MSNIKYKSMPAKDFTAGDNGTISGYFSTFHHDKTDSYGDVIRKGAFQKTIEERKASGHPFPLCYNHDFDQVIGYVTDIGEDNYGAYFTAKFFSSERAQEIRNIVISGALWQFSFAYDVLDSGKITLSDGTKATELRELELYEISVVCVPANDRTMVTEVKTAPKKRLYAEDIISLTSQLKSKDSTLSRQAAAILREELRACYDAVPVYEASAKRWSDNLGYREALNMEQAIKTGLGKLQDKIYYLEKALNGFDVTRDSILENWPAK